MQVDFERWKNGTGAGWKPRIISELEGEPTLEELRQDLAGIEQHIAGVKAAYASTLSETGFREYLRQKETAAKSIRKQIENLEFLEDFNDTLARLQEIDQNWADWYDGRPEQTKGEMLPLMKARIAELGY